MTEEIKKLSNVQYEITDEVLARKWADVKAKKTRLLSISDWTQLPDTNLPANIRKLWVQWRSKIRNIKKAIINEPDKALALLHSLEQQMPERINPSELPNFANIAQAEFIENKSDEDSFKQFKKYIDDVVANDVIPSIVSLDDVRNLIKEANMENTKMLVQHFEQVIDKKINTSKVTTINLPNDLEEAKSVLKMILNDKSNKKYTHSNHELFTEAIDYLSSPTGKFPLLQIYANNLNKSLDDMAKNIIETKKEWLRQICKIEDFRLKYLNKIDQSSSIEELHQLKLEIV